MEDQRGPIERGVWLAVGEGGMQPLGGEWKRSAAMKFAANTALVALLFLSSNVLGCANGSAAKRPSAGGAVSGEPVAEKWLEGCTAKGSPAMWSIECDRLFASFSLNTETSAQTQINAWLVGIRAGYPGEVQSEPGVSRYGGAEREGMAIALLNREGKALIRGHVTAFRQADDQVRTVSCMAHIDYGPERCQLLKDWFASHQSLPVGVTQKLNENDLFDLRGWLAAKGSPVPGECSVGRQKNGAYQVTCPKGAMVLVPMGTKGQIADSERLSEGLNATLKKQYESTSDKVESVDSRCEDKRGEIKCAHLKITIRGDEVEAISSIMLGQTMVFVQCIYNDSPVEGDLPCPIHLMDAAAPGRSL